MATASSPEITQLLQAWCDGDQSALERLVPLIEAKLRRLARRCLAQEHGHTLQTMDLINEAYMRLIDWRNVRWQNRAHFFSVAATLMRRILVDYARRRPRIKLPGEEQRVSPQRVSLEEALEVSRERVSELVALDDALNTLAALDPRKCQIVELRYFGGLDLKEMAEVLDISPNTVTREWNKARAWLYCELNGKDGDDA